MLLMWGKDAAIHVALREEVVCMILWQPLNRKFIGWPGRVGGLDNQFNVEGGLIDLLPR